MIEADRVILSEGNPDVVWTPTNSGKGQKIARCSTCRVTLWSNYAGAGDSVRFIRVGTLEQPDRLPPNIHIFAASKQPWVIIPRGMPVFEEYYDRERVWAAASITRMHALLRQQYPT